MTGVQPIPGSPETIPPPPWADAEPTYPAGTYVVELARYSITVTEHEPWALAEIDEVAAPPPVVPPPAPVPIPPP